MRHVLAIGFTLAFLLPSVLGATAGELSSPSVYAEATRALDAYAAAGGDPVIASAVAPILRSLLGPLDPESALRDAALAAPPSAKPGIAEAQRALAAAREPEPLAAALALAWRGEARLPPVTVTDDAVEAFVWVHLAHGVAAPAEDVAALARLQADAPALTIPIARMLSAHAHQVHATKVALATGELKILDEARARVAPLLVEAATQSRTSSLDPNVRIGTCSALVLLNLSLGASVYPAECNVRFLFDLGGDDVYLNAAGGVSGEVERIGTHPESTQGLDLVTWALSLAGIECDTEPFTGECRMDANVLSTVPCIAADGRLLDMGAEFDRYACSEPASMLIDADGDDAYTPVAYDDGRDLFAPRGLVGGGSYGSGFLLDVAGDDLYAPVVTKSLYAPPGHVAVAAVNGGALGGSGTLLDLAGDDRYGGSIVRGAANGAGLEGGSGFLYDHAGADVYAIRATGRVATSGAAESGMGILVDVAGNDRYEDELLAGGVAVGAAGTGLGVLIDQEGDDVYRPLVAVQGAAIGAGITGVGVLVDLAGSDAFTTRVAAGAATGAAVVGVGVLVDDGPGTNHFTGPAPAAGAHVGAVGGRSLIERNFSSSFANLAAFNPAVGEAVNATPATLRNGTHRAPLPGGAAILVAGSGDHHYDTNGTTQGAADLYGLALLVDLGGHNTYRAGPDGLAQGAGRDGGIGALVDAGATATFEIDGATIGQGAALQGVGALLRVARDGSTELLANGLSEPARLSGAGLGLRIDLGEAILGGARLPDFRCPAASPEYANQTVGGDADTPRVTTRVCGMDADDAQPLRHPLSGQPVGDLPRPAVPCDAVALACDQAESVLGPDARGEMEAERIRTTTSGGVKLQLLRDPVANIYVGEFTKVIEYADGQCTWSCHAVNGVLVG